MHFGFVYKLFHKDHQNDVSKWYIGACQSVNGRFNKHMSDLGKSSKTMYSIMREIGTDGWTIQILETVSSTSDDPLIRRHELGTVERDYQRKIQPGLNTIKPLPIMKQNLKVHICKCGRDINRCTICRPDGAERNRFMCRERQRLKILSKATGKSIEELKEERGLTQVMAPMRKGPKSSKKSCEHVEPRKARCKECTKAAINQCSTAWYHRVGKQRRLDRLAAAAAPEVVAGGN